MKKKQEKSPILAGFLNFILPGIGYVYAGKRVGFGVGLFVATIFYLFATSTYSYTGVDWFFGFVIAFLFAYDGYQTAEEVNK